MNRPIYIYISKANYIKINKNMKKRKKKKKRKKNKKKKKKKGTGTGIGSHQALGLASGCTGAEEDLQETQVMDKSLK